MDYQAANEFMAKRLTMLTNKSSREIADSIPAKVRAQCFFSSRVAQWHVAKKIKEAADAVAHGELSVDEARVRLERWMDANRIGDKTGTRISNISSAARLNLILTQNAKMAAGVGRYQVARDPDIEERWPSWRYIAGYNPRHTHAVHDGKVYLKSDPFWASHYPPWDFGCNCDVEDSDESPITAPKDDGKPPESGFAFNPADAFGRFDLSTVTDADARFKIREDAEIEFGSQVEFEENGTTVKIIQRNFHTFEDEKLEPSSAWREKAPAAPEKNDAAEARSRLQKGFEVRSADGKKLEFGRKILDHWETEKNKSSPEIAGRLNKLDMAVETVLKPAEIWDQQTQTAYIQAFRKSGGGASGCLVFVGKDGGVRTYFPKDLNALDKARKGVSVKRFVEEKGTD